MLSPIAPEIEAALVAAALAAREHAYAPYSGFRVGAAALDAEGRIHAGCNVENAAYPQGQCAEATALGAMVTAGGLILKAIAIAGPETGPEGPFLTPCGGCRQRIREFAAGNLPILACQPGGIVARHTLADLLPESFGPGHLG
ncbi:MAG: cytidine deaminase [Pseudomonadota bacterium]